MESIYIFIVVAAIAVIIIISIIFFNKKAIVKRNMKKTVRKPIYSYKNQEVAKVIGKVEFIGEPLIAPLSGRKCAYYHVLVQKKNSNGKSSSWVKLIEEEVPGKFLIRDGSTCAIVDTSLISTYLVPDRNYSSGFMNDAESNLEKYLAMHGQSSKGIFGFNKTIRYKEGILEEGELVGLTGMCEWRDVSGSLSSGKVLVISSNDKTPVYLSDDPKVYED